MSQKTWKIMMQTLNGNSQSITSEMKVREYYPTRFCFMVKL